MNTIVLNEPVTEALNGAAMIRQLARMNLPLQAWRRPLVLSACACVRRALAHLEADEDRPKRALAAAEGLTDGTVDIGAARLATEAARDAVAASYARILTAVPQAHTLAAEAAVYAAETAIAAFHTDDTEERMLARAAEHAALALELATNAVAIAAATAAGSDAAPTGGLSAYCFAFRAARFTATSNERRMSARIVSRYFQVAFV